MPAVPDPITIAAAHTGRAGDTARRFGIAEECVHAALLALRWERHFLLALAAHGSTLRLKQADRLLDLLDVLPLSWGDKTELRAAGNAVAAQHGARRRAHPGLAEACAEAGDNDNSEPQEGAAPPWASS